MESITVNATSEMTFEQGVRTVSSAMDLSLAAILKNIDGEDKVNNGEDRRNIRI